METPSSDAARHLLALALLCGGCGRDAPKETPPAPPSASAPSVVASTSASARVETLDERAARIHREAIVIDGHDDIPMVMAATGFDLGKPDGKTHTDLPRMKAGGVTGEFFSIFVDRVYVGNGAARRALQLIDLVYQQVERHPDHLVLARTAADIRKAKADQKIAALMGLEGGHAIENSLSALRDFHRLGVRYMTLTHTNTNDWADSAGFSGPAVVRHHGLSPFGERVVAEMQRIGMLVDVSHVSDETFFAVMRVAKAPVIASHSSARAIRNDRRNLSDEMLRALAKNGGVAMVNFWPRYLDPDYDKKPRPTTKLSVLIDHIEHMVEVAGEDHVGLGSDFDGVDSLPEGMTGIDGLPSITRALLERGHGEARVKKILGGNFLRVLEAAEAFAAATKSTLSGDGDFHPLEAAPAP